MKNSYLETYLSKAPVSLAIVRSIECRLLDELDDKHSLFNHPMLDLGCGDGLFASIYFKNKIHMGIDISKSEIGKAQKTNMYDNLNISDAKDLPFENNYFSSVFSNCVLEHIPNVELVIKELSRVLKKDGTVTFTVPSNILSKELFFSKIFSFLKLHFASKLYADFTNTLLKHINLYDIDKWTNILNNNGFTVLEIKRYLSPKSTRIYDIMSYPGLISKITKLLFGRWILSQKFRNIISIPLLTYLLRDEYTRNSDSDGISLIIIAKK